MITLTREQRVALKRVYERSVYEKQPGEVPTYRAFRKTVQPEVCGWGAVMVPFAGMWLGIERDGHTHS